jgi:fumarate hydratase class II
MEEFFELAIRQKKVVAAAFCAPFDVERFQGGAGGGFGINVKAVGARIAKANAQGVTGAQGVRLGGPLDPASSALKLGIFDGDF